MRRIHEMPFGAQVLADGQVRFQLWATSAVSVELCVYSQEGAETRFAMQNLSNGWFQFASAHTKFTNGSLYRYLIDGLHYVPDPASRANPHDVHGPSQVVDATLFNWQDDDWRGRPWHEAVIYELHVGTFSKAGRFTGVIERLKYLVALGVTAIELMPVADFPGTRNWGYDGVLPFAPDHSYGSPDDLKMLVQAAHSQGLMVLLDVVYNHFGPDGNYLRTYAPEFFSDRHETPWGAAINFDGTGSHVVREFFIQNALYWLEEYHFDGLRIDAVQTILDDSVPHILDELAARIHDGPGQHRHVHLILENDNNAARYLKPGRFTAQWNDDFHHALHLLVTGECDGYYADYAAQPIVHLGRCLAEGFSFQGEPSAHRGGRLRGEPSSQLSLGAFINYLQTHDQTANRLDGKRMCMIARQRPLKIALAILLLAPSTPMIFMGEEYGATTPFQYFCDFQGALADAVTKGRQKEFDETRKFSKSVIRESFQRPNELASFLGSKLDWECLNESQHKNWLFYYQTLLALRHRYILPLLSDLHTDKWNVAGATGIVVRWQEGGGLVLTLAVNLGDGPISEIPDFFQLRPSSFSTEKIYPIFLSQHNLMDYLSVGQLPPWSVAWLIQECET